MLVGTWGFSPWKHIKLLIFFILYMFKSFHIQAITIIWKRHNQQKTKDIYLSEEKNNTSMMIRFKENKEVSSLWLQISLQRVSAYLFLYIINPIFYIANFHWTTKLLLLIYFLNTLNAISIAERLLYFIHLMLVSLLSEALLTKIVILTTQALKPWPFYRLIIIAFITKIVVVYILAVTLPLVETNSYILLFYWCSRKSIIRSLCLLR